MNGYFKPLRRKIGVVTLGLACVFMAGWVDSTVQGESIVISIGQIYWVGFISAGGAFEADVGAYNEPESSFWKSFAPDDAADPMGNPPRVPYWSIVLPLTLFSAWLLLSKVRVKSPPATPK